MDIVGSLAGLLIIVPFVLFIAIAIKFDSKGPVIAKLDRVSNGKTIKLYKFRSMTYDAESKKKDLMHLNERKDGPFFKIKDDPRLTKVGKKLRKFRIDEFPQLLNVLKGELALVGPRPHEPGEVAQYPEKYKGLLKARAGATGLSQVSGASGLPFLVELELDKEYLGKRSPMLDIRIIIRTVAILFFDPTAV